ncbi:MAG: hypothetical protein KDB69_10130, partial [Acidimicrobiia bacterium]|nr:hypothetical protein [Acidimicrobiia bacterium]
AHIANPGRLADVVVDLGMPRGVAFVPVGVETAILVLLLLAPQIGGAATIAYLGTVVAWIALRRIQGLTIQDCGCFHSRVPAGRRFFVRNALLLMLAAGVTELGSHGIGGPALVPAASISALAMLWFRSRLNHDQGPDPVQPGALINQVEA